MELGHEDINLKEDAPNLLEISKSNPFKVPESYFSELGLQIKSRVKLETYRFEDEAEHSLPGSYFEELQEDINSRISLLKIQDTTPSSGFKIPEDYFTQLEQRIEAAVGIEKSASRAVKLFPAWSKWAAAACTTVIVGLSLYFNSDSYKFDEQLSRVPDQEIINYLQVHTTAGDTPYIIENLSPEQLEQLNPDISEKDLEIYLENTTL